MALLVSLAQKQRPFAVEALLVMQHRGQDAAGVASLDTSHAIHYRKKSGLVRDVFRTQQQIEALVGSMAIGHVRYPTAGSMADGESQPMYVNTPYGIALAHNGNLTNDRELKTQLFQAQRRHINTHSDSEVLLNVFAHELLSQPAVHNHHSDDADTIFQAVAQTAARCKGAYSVTALIAGKGLLAFRDPHGIRPLCWGTRKHGNSTDYMVASESVALQAHGFSLAGEVAPGEALFIDTNGILHRQQYTQAQQLTPCLFEYVYFARPDSMMNQVSVYRARMNMGTYLGKKIQRQWDWYQSIDIVVPVPDSSRICALALAQQTGIAYREGLIKNHYIGRTFIMNGQGNRQQSVRRKLNPVTSEFVGKRVLLVDDSIVRGNTSKQIIKIVREAGVKEVYFASAAPPVRFANAYGIDMPDKQDLIANARSELEVSNYLGCDALIFQDVVDLHRSVADESTAITNFEDSVFTGSYIIGNDDGKIGERTLERWAAS